MTKFFPLLQCMILTLAPLWHFLTSSQMSALVLIAPRWSSPCCVILLFLLIRSADRQLWALAVSVRGGMLKQCKEGEDLLKIVRAMESQQKMDWQHPKTILMKKPEGEWVHRRWQRQRTVVITVTGVLERVPQQKLQPEIEESSSCSPWGGMERAGEQTLPPLISC